MSFAIRVDNLGKRYQLGATHAGSLRELVNHGWNRLLGRSNATARQRTLDLEAADRVEGKSFWALRDVCFEVKPGEVVGIIGRNGSGKSTLLKILSQITAPTTGRVELHGRVASLLEVGTGFHPELSGRENVFLNGAILGMSKPEIRCKFDEIVAFAEIEKFIDTPVKRYSSGMYVRLAFAVAAHLEPEILVVDEVLAVGDLAFQRKCLAKMGSVSQSGKTILFVSHNLAAIRSLCNNCVGLDRGTLAIQGSTDLCIDKLFAFQGKDLAHTAIFPDNSAEFAWMRSVKLSNQSGPSAILKIGDQILIDIEFEALEPVKTPQIGFIISTVSGDNVLNANSHYQKATYSAVPVRKGVIRCDLGRVPLMPGIYSISFWFGTQHIDTHVTENALRFEVIEKDIWGLGKTPPKNCSVLWWPTRFCVEAIETA